MAEEDTKCAALEGAKMIQYKGSIYRPPSEASSLILQATIGCSNYLSLAGDLQKDKQRLLKTIDEVLDDPESRDIRPEHLRSL